MTTGKSGRKSRAQPKEKIAQNDLLGQPVAGVIAPESHTWSLATNHLNLLFMLGAGMVTGPSGFGGKYYSDSLSISSGWVPLFRGTVPASVLELAVRDAGYLKPCVARFDLSQIRCSACALGSDGNMRTCTFPDEVTQDDTLLLLAAPLPTTLLREVWLADKEAGKVFEDRAKDAANVDLDRIARRMDVPISDRTLTLPFDPASGVAARDDRQALASGQARGGILAMLCNIANRSDLALAAFRSAFERQPCAKDANAIAKDPILAELPGWLQSATVSESAETRARLFWGVVDAIIRAKAEGTALKPIDQALRFLESQLGALREDVYRPRLERLIKELRSTASGFGGGTISQLLEHHKGSFSRSLLLFCLRDSCEELLEFSHPALEDTEFVLAAVLFGARDGWAGLPNTLRKPQALADFVSRWMAKTVHHDSGTVFDYGVTLQRPTPLRELFGRADEDWTKIQKEAALELARKQKWTDCIRTRISLGRGDYRLSIDGAGAHLLLDGDVKAVVALVDMDGIMRALASRKVDSRTEHQMRELLGTENREQASCK